MWYTQHIILCELVFWSALWSFEETFLFHSFGSQFSVETSLVFKILWTFHPGVSDICTFLWKFNCVFILHPTFTFYLINQSLGLSRPSLRFLKRHFNVLCGFIFLFEKRKEMIIVFLLQTQAISRWCCPRFHLSCTLFIRWFPLAPSCPLQEITGLLLSSLWPWQHLGPLTGLSSWIRGRSWK